jgi:dihydroorotate dehydrogenase (NAD+) catalytic subunit
MGLTVRIGKVTLQNPVCAASGTFGYAREMAGAVRLDRLGAVFTKAVTLRPRQGNPPDRIAETPSGLLNAIGLANVGVEAFVRDKLPFLKALKCRVFVNVAGSAIPEYEAVILRLEEARGVDGYEINISCPNVKKGGISFSSRPGETRRIVRALRRVTGRTMIVKLSPNVTDITEYARICEGEGADAVSLINTLVGMVVDVRTRRPMLSNVTGGLSGPAIRPVGVAMVYKAARAVAIPVIGIGGILAARDALEYLISGAAAVQIGTGNFVDPKTPEKVLDGIREYMKNNRMKSMGELTGSIRVPG